MVTKENEMLACYIIPAKPMPFVLPEDCVADVLADPVIAAPETKSAGWVCGHSDWQEQRLSVMWYDDLIRPSSQKRSKDQSRLVVLNPVPGSARLVYSALLCSGDVQKIEIDERAEFVDIPADLDKRYIENVMIYQGQKYIIPKLAALAVAFSYI